MTSPGAYLKARRIAAGLSLQDVAEQFITIPCQAELLRIDWMKRIEADVAPIRLDTIAVPGRVFAIDVQLL